MSCGIGLGRCFKMELKGEIKEINTYKETIDDEFAFVNFLLKFSNIKIKDKNFEIKTTKDNLFEIKIGKVNIENIVKEMKIELVPGEYPMINIESVMDLEKLTK